MEPNTSEWEVRIFLCEEKHFHNMFMWPQYYCAPIILKYNFCIQHWFRDFASWEKLQKNGGNFFAGNIKDLQLRPSEGDLDEPCRHPLPQLCHDPPQLRHCQVTIVILLVMIMMMMKYGEIKEGLIEDLVKYFEGFHQRIQVDIIGLLFAHHLKELS